MADSLSMFISMANYKMPERIRRNCSRSFQLPIKSRFRLTLREPASLVHQHEHLRNVYGSFRPTNVS